MPQFRIYCIPSSINSYWALQLATYFLISDAWFHTSDEKLKALSLSKRKRHGIFKQFQVYSITFTFFAFSSKEKSLKVQKSKHFFKKDFLLAEFLEKSVLSAHC